MPHHPPPDPHESQPYGGSRRQDAPIHVSLDKAAVCQLTLSNPSNYCYANSIINSVVWVASQCSQGIEVCRLLRWLVHKPQRVCLWRVRAWQTLTRRWENPARQHCAAEFLQHLAEVFTPERGDFWQARLNSGTSTEVVDHGDLWPLLLNVAPQLGNDSTCSLQSFFSSWRNQARRHALVSLPSVLPVHLCRFSDAGDKDNFKIALSRRVYVPFFSGTGITTASHPCQLTAIVYHLGPTKLSGHYRAALLTEGDITWVTDDEETPRQPSHHECQEVLNNAYILFCSDCRSTCDFKLHGATTTFRASPTRDSNAFFLLLMGRITPGRNQPVLLTVSFSILILYPIIVSYFIIMMHVAARS